MIIISKSRKRRNWGQGDCGRWGPGGPRKGRGRELDDEWREWTRVSDFGFLISDCRFWVSGFVGFNNLKSRR